MNVTGPISTLPGSYHLVPNGIKCDSHSNQYASFRVQGETDRFGSEMVDMCDECHERYKAELISSEVSYCDWCAKLSHVIPFRCPDEGSNGPIYNICQSCKTSTIDQFLNDLEDTDNDDEI